MSSYNSFERRIARTLKKFPGFQQIKAFYHRMNYLWYAKKGVKAVLAPDVSLVELDETNDFFFGYYDKSPWSENGEKVLYHRLTDDGKAVEIVCWNLPEKQTRVLGITAAWNLQQGSMTQWLPQSDDLVIFNQFNEERALIAEIRSSTNGAMVRKLPIPIQTIRKDGKAAVSLNYRRLAVLRPDYGYTCDAKNFSPNQADDQDGLFFVDMESGKTELIVAIEKLKSLHDFPRLSNPHHKVNHAMYAPSGNRLVFMHRCMHSHGKKDRLYLVNDDGTDLMLILDDDMVSHYSWIDDHSLICYCRTKEFGDGYYEINLKTCAKTPVAKDKLWQYGDGHPSMAPKGRYIMTDTYPDRARMQHLYLYDTKNDQVTDVAQFFSALKFSGSKRCDFHPRWSPDGNFVSIDTIETGKRKMRLIDVSKLVE